MRHLILAIGFIGTAAIIGLLGTISYTLYDADDVATINLTTSAAKLFRTDVAIAEVPISLKTGAGQIIGFKVQNPTGFSAETAIHTPTILFETNVSRSGPSTIFISKMTIERPRILLEIKDGQANLSRLMQALNAANANVGTEDQGLKIIVAEVLMENGTVSLSADTLGDPVIETPLPDSRITDIGVAENGIGTAALMDQLTSFVIKSTERATRRIDIATIALERGLSKPNFDLKTLLAE